MNIQPYQITLFGHTINFPASKVFANSIHKAWKPIEEKWRKNINNDFYKTFENLDDLYKNSDKLAQDVLCESINAALGILAENSIYDVDEQNFLENHLTRMFHKPSDPAEL